MLLVVKSFLLSFRVLLKMVLPAIGVLVASIIVWAIFSALTFGLSDYVSAQLTSTFLAMLGIRAALSVTKYDRRQADLRELLLLSVRYGLFTLIAMRIMVVLANTIAIVATDWSLAELGSFQTLESTIDLGSELLRPYAFTVMPVTFLLLLCVVPTAMAVPFAAAANSASIGGRGHSFFFGLGRSFLPLYAIFFSLGILLTGFDLLSQLYLSLSLIYVVFGVFGGGELTSDSIEIFLKGAASGTVVLWLSSWVWSASALALMKFQEVPETTDSSKSMNQENSMQDLRELRRSRTQSTD